jgi:hypothetical protein
LFSASHVWEVPVGQGRRFLSSLPRAVDSVFGGWALAGIVTLRSGSPFNVTLGADVNDDGATDDRPALARGDLADLYASGLGKTRWLLPQTDARALLVTPASVTDPFASIARNAFRAPRVMAYDVSISKRIVVGERVILGVEANAFNLFNRAQLGPPTSALNSGFFGAISSTLTGANPRQMQFGLRVSF